MLRSSAQVSRAFCAACGTALAYQNLNTAQEIDVTIASLDQPQTVAPADHTQTGHRLPWFSIHDSLRQYPHNRSAGVKS
ncbi:hypothetical protein GTP69_00145 [Duganella sp. CY42W]|uniref:CENP-V/GFA domain-containing protein n=1 Tax=Duganella levis TaxID=2692169 RepID=A0ABW9VT64_9BURK|nr:hypothetical protein [Duganella levis]